jgi:hypothetical protein
VAGRSKVLRWPYLPRLAVGLSESAITHHGGSAVAWVRIVLADGSAVTSADPSLIACSRLLLEQHDVEESA